MKGETREELFESKIDRVKIIDGKRYVLDEWGNHDIKHFKDLYSKGGNWKWLMQIR
jgi:hypothetical protein